MVRGWCFSGSATDSWARAVISMKAPSTPPWMAGSMGLPTMTSENGRMAVISSPASSARTPMNRA